MPKGEAKLNKGQRLACPKERVIPSIETGEVVFVRHDDEVLLPHHYPSRIAQKGGASANRGRLSTPRDCATTNCPWIGCFIVADLLSLQPLDYSYPEKDANTPPHRLGKLTRIRVCVIEDPQREGHPRGENAAHASILVKEENQTLGDGFIVTERMKKHLQVEGMKSWFPRICELWAKTVTHVPIKGFLDEI